MSESYSDDKVNLMLKSEWKILDSYNVAYESDNGLSGGSTLYYVLGHKDSDVQVPLTKQEIKRQKDLQRPADYLVDRSDNPPWI